MCSKFDHDVDSFVCYNYPATYQCGRIVSTFPYFRLSVLIIWVHILCLLHILYFIMKYSDVYSVLENYDFQCLPSAILAKYGCNVRKRVYVELPTSALWCGMHDRRSNCIACLESLFFYYDVKQNHFFVLFYNGGHKFSLEIFNIYGVQITYNMQHVESNMSASPDVEPVWVNDCYYLSTDLNLDKLCGQFSFNCNTLSFGSYDLIIEKQHLEAKIYNKVSYT